MRHTRMSKVGLSLALGVVCALAGPHLAMADDETKSKEGAEKGKTAEPGAEAGKPAEKPVDEAESPIAKPLTGLPLPPATHRTRRSRSGQR